MKLRLLCEAILLLPITFIITLVELAEYPEPIESLLLILVPPECLLVPLGLGDMKRLLLNCDLKSSKPPYDFYYLLR